MPGFWQITNRGSVGLAASATQLSPAGSLNGGQQVRLRALQCKLSGPGADADLLVVRDGVSGAGTIIWQEDFQMIANDNGVIFLTGLDIRASVGNPLTVEFTLGVNGDRETVNAQGDYVPSGWPLGQP